SDGSQVVPGNLVFVEGAVVSQTVEEIALFPELAAILKDVDRRLAKDRKDPVGLLMRGTLRTDKGDLAGAVEDFRDARAAKPEAEVLAEVREKLYEVLTDYLQQDFDKAEKYLDDYRELCKVEPREGAGLDEKKAAEEVQRRRQVR